MSRAGSKLSRLWRAPVRALCRARDFYVRSVTSCAGHLPPDAALGFPEFGALPRDDNFASRADEDLRELIRAASQRRRGDGDGDGDGDAAVPRSRSVAMARIDEDRPCEFAGAGLVYPRSRSCVGGAGWRARVAALG